MVINKVDGRLVTELHQKPLQYSIVIVLYDISIKLSLQKLHVIIEFCDNGASARAKSSLGLTEDIVNSE